MVNACPQPSASAVSDRVAALPRADDEVAAKGKRPASTILLR
jgi:hypothetical protein